jgi:ABC-type multidrug transport system ATPase subunit
MLQLKNLTVISGHKTVCENLSLEIDKGTTLIIHGSNGSGKTTLIECLIGHREPNSGQVLLDQHDLHHLGRQEKKLFRESTGIALQQSLLRPLDSIKKTLSLLHKDKDKIDGMLEFLGFHQQNILVKNLSWGEIRRLDLVRSLANDPSLLIWDEPFLGLDDHYREKFQSLLLKLKHLGSTIIVATKKHKHFEFLNPEKILEL